MMLHSVERIRVQGNLPAPDRHEQPEDPHIERSLVRPELPTVPTFDRPVVQSPGVSDNAPVSRPGPTVPQIVERVSPSAPEVPQTARRDTVVAPSAPELPLGQRSIPQEAPQLPGMQIQRGEPMQPQPIEQPSPADHAFPPELIRRYDIATHHVHWV